MLGPRALSRVGAFALLLLSCISPAPFPGTEALIIDHPAQIAGSRPVLGFTDTTTAVYPRIGARVPKTPTKPASDEEYKTAKDKGWLLMCAMRNPTKVGSVGTSKFDRFEQLGEWGWTGYRGAPINLAPNYHGDSNLNFMPMFDGSDKSRSVSYHVVLQHTRSHPSITHQGRTFDYPPTDAQYHNIYNPYRGVIVASFNWGPEWSVTSGNADDWDENKDLLPELKHLSDIWWLTWAKVCANENKDPKGLLAVARHSVQSESTKAMIARVLQMHFGGEAEPSKGRAPAWPGKSIDIDMEGFSALVNTPNVVGVGYMLLQRHQELGRREIKSIRVWNGSPGAKTYEPHLLIEIGKVE